MRIGEDELPFTREDLDELTTHQDGDTVLRKNKVRHVRELREQMREKHASNERTNTRERAVGEKAHLLCRRFECVRECHVRRQIRRVDLMNGS